jgi:hypothetical protein
MSEERDDSIARQQRLLEHILNELANLAECVAELQESTAKIRKRLDAVERATPLKRPSTPRRPT